MRLKVCKHGALSLNMATVVIVKVRVLRNSLDMKSGHMKLIQSGRGSSQLQAPCRQGDRVPAWLMKTYDWPQG